MLLFVASIFLHTYLKVYDFIFEKQNKSVRSSVDRQRATNFYIDEWNIIFVLFYTSQFPWYDKVVWNEI